MTPTSSSAFLSLRLSFTSTSSSSSFFMSHLSLSGSGAPYYLIFLHSNVDAVKAENKTHKTFMASMPPVATALFDCGLSWKGLWYKYNCDMKNISWKIFSGVTYTYTEKRDTSHKIFSLSETRPCRCFLSVSPHLHSSGRVFSANPSPKMIPMSSTHEV